MFLFDLLFTKLFDLSWMLTIEVLSAQRNGFPNCGLGFSLA
jgi:hypothetical protein